MILKNLWYICQVETERRLIVVKEYINKQIKSKRAKHPTQKNREIIKSREIERDNKQRNILK